MRDLKGLATGIGSLPHQDVEVALDLIFKYTPQIPFWPQLPKRDVREGMVAQFSENLPCLKVSRDGLFFSAGSQEKELEIFYEHIIANDIGYFKISPDFALGLHKFYQRLKDASLKDIEFIKCQITGPFTFGASIKDEQGSALLHNSVFMQAVLKGLMMKALWQIEFFKEFNPSQKSPGFSPRDECPLFSAQEGASTFRPRGSTKKIIMFVDEPYLGCFGSAYTPINREDVVKCLGELTGSIKSDNVLTGVHCCGNTDWSIFTDIKTIDIINFDSYSFLERFVLYADNLKGFLERGGIICWGIVPTQEFSGRETADLLIRKIKDSIDILVKKGMDKDLLSGNLLVSPACGLGTLDASKSDKIFRLLSEVSFCLRKNSQK